MLNTPEKRLLKAIGLLLHWVEVGSLDCERAAACIENSLNNSETWLLEKHLQEPVMTLDWSSRAQGIFLANNIQTLGDLVSCNAESLREIRNCGETTVDEIRDRLKRVGLALKGE